MWTLAPIAQLARRRVFGERSLADAASRSWTLAEPETARTPPAIALPGQLDRVTGWMFGEERDQRASLAGRTVVHGATRAHLFRDAVLVDGSVYVGGRSKYLLRRAGRLPRLHVEHAIDRASMYATENGNRWFGMWLIDDCTSYALAAAQGAPLTTDHAISPQMRVYESWLGMTPRRVSSARIAELVLFDDVGHNASKRARFGANRDKLRARVAVENHPGTFLLRGLAGDRRLLANELELAEHLATTRGFTVIDPMTSTLETILGSCAGAATIVGVEGSALAHGLAVARPDATLLVLEPPDRFCALYKDLTDRDGQRFAYVVGTPIEGSFVVDREELDRTLDLLR